MAIGLAVQECHTSSIKRPVWGRRTDMSDYAISIKVRNGRIRRKMAECGFSSVNELCRNSDLSPTQIGALLNLKLPPLTETGSWRRSAADLAEALGCTCEELFSETQRTLTLRENRGECFVTEAELLKLSSRAEQPLLENPGEQLLEDLDAQAKIEVVRRALDELKLAARDRHIINSYFGIDCEELTQTELASQLDISQQFVQYCLNRTLSRLRAHKPAARRSLLQAYQPVNAMGTADEARIRITQKRADVLPTEKKAVVHAGERHTSPSCWVME